MASLCSGPNPNCFQTGEAPSRRHPYGPLLWSDWEKLTTLPLSGEKRHAALACHPLQELRGDVSLQWGAVKTPSFQNFPRSVSAAPLGTTFNSRVLFLLQALL